MNDVKRVVWYLRKIPLLAELGGESLARLAERVEMKEVRRREVVYLPGDPGASLFFVNGGRIKVSKVTRDGKSLTLAYCGPSEIFGETCLIDGGPRAEMAEAVENALLTEVERSDFERLVASTPGLAQLHAFGHASDRIGSQVRKERDLAQVPENALRIRHEGIVALVAIIPKHVVEITKEVQRS